MIGSSASETLGQSPTRQPKAAQTGGRAGTPIYSRIGNRTYDWRSQQGRSGQRHARRYVRSDRQNDSPDPARARWRTSSSLRLCPRPDQRGRSAHVERRPDPTLASSAAHSGRAAHRTTVNLFAGLVFTDKAQRKGRTMANETRSRRERIPLSCGRCGATMRLVAHVPALGREPALDAFECAECGHLESFIRESRT